MMAGPAIEFNRPGMETQIPDYIKSLQARVAKAEAASPAPDNLPRLRQALAEAAYFFNQKSAVAHVLPDRTFTRGLTLDLGGRTVEVRHHDRAVTPGDAYLYLPAERVLVTGDFLVNPVSFALSSYPTTWLGTLEHLDAIDASVIVPDTARRCATRRCSTRRWTRSESCCGRARPRRREGSVPAPRLRRARWPADRCHRADSREVALVTLEARARSRH